MNLRDYWVITLKDGKVEYFSTSVTGLSAIQAIQHAGLHMNDVQKVEKELSR